MTEFFKTSMGRSLIERDAPELLRVLKQLNANLKRIADALEDRRAPAQPPAPPPAG